MITSEQIRMARALLDISQETLAGMCGKTKATIANIERGASKGQPQTLIDIENALTYRGIEFLEDDGVRRKPEKQIYVYEGAPGFVEFLKDVHNVVKSAPEVVVNNVDELLFVHWEGDFFEVHQERMKNAGARSRIIVQEGDENLVATEYAEYRWASKEHFSTTSYYIYGDRAALIDFQENNVFVYVIRNKAISDFFRNEFQTMWGLSKAPHT